MEFSIQYLCDAAAHALSQQSAYENDKKKLRIKKVSLVNNSVISCEFYPHAKESAGIKNEVAFIMGFFASFFRDDFRFDYIQNFAARAFAVEQTQEVELIYAMSAPDVADFIAEGKAIQWITNSIFQDNTADYRLLTAKRYISQLENALRELIDKVFSEIKGEYWWDSFTSNINNFPRNISKLRKKDKGNTSPRVLLDQTYLSNLRDIIIQNWQYFDKVFQTEKSIIEKILTDLNGVRCDEAHNRKITHEKSKQLENIRVVSRNLRWYFAKRRI